MKKQFKYPKSFEEQKKIPKITQKRIKLAEASLGDFEGRLVNLTTPLPSRLELGLKDSLGAI